MRILVPYDGSLHAQCALVEAGVRAEDEGAEVTILTVIARHARPHGISAELELEADANERHRAAALLAQARAEFGHGTAVSALVRNGHPVEQIIEVILAGEHDLVVMGSCSRGRFHSMREGSVAREVRRRSPVPVVLTPAVPFRDRRPFGRLRLPVA